MYNECKNVRNILLSLASKVVTAAEVDVETCYKAGGACFCFFPKK